MFKNPKLLKITKLYNKIINDFKVEKVYMEQIVGIARLCLIAL